MREVYGQGWSLHEHTELWNSCRGYLGFEESTRRDFAKLDGLAVKVMKGLVQGRMETAMIPRSWQVPSTRAT